jgi:hypothetical protein
LVGQSAIAIAASSPLPWLPLPFTQPGYLVNSHGIDGPFIDGLPIKNGDFPWLC